MSDLIDADPMDPPEVFPTDVPPEMTPIVPAVVSPNGAWTISISDDGVVAAAPVDQPE